jgi:CRISPR/Cas system-associated endoribonuclease Cas2
MKTYQLPRLVKYDIATSEKQNKKVEKMKEMASCW